MHRRTFSALVCAVAVLLAAGLTAADLESPDPLSSVGSRAKETELGDLAADALRAADGAVAAILPAGSLKEVTIPAGRVKTDQVLACLQYPDDKIAVLGLTGKQVVQALERSVGVYPQKNLGFLQVSGLTFVFDPNAPKGSRVSRVEIGKRDVDASKEYRVITTAPLARGGYGYFTVWGKDTTKEFKDRSLGEAVTRFLKDRRTVDYRKKTRITAKKEKAGGSTGAP